MRNIDVQESKCEHEAGQYSIAQRLVQASNEWQRNQDNPDINSDNDEGSGPKDAVRTNTVALMLAIPSRPEIVKRSTAKYYGEVEGDATSNNQHKCEPDKLAR
jgi:hypothetical protein